MKTPYLIQRLKKRSDCQGTLDECFIMDYMGSAEFEFGALPTSFKRITKNFDDFVIKNTGIKKFDGEEMFILYNHKQIDVDKYIDYIKRMVTSDREKTIRTKESTHLQYIMAGPSSMFYSCGASIVGWWDIENDVMFCFTKNTSKKLKHCIEKTKEKKKAEKAEGWF